MNPSFRYWCALRMSSVRVTLMDTLRLFMDNPSIMPCSARGHDQHDTADPMLPMCLFRNLTFWLLVHERGAIRAADAGGHGPPGRGFAAFWLLAGIAARS